MFYPILARLPQTDRAQTMVNDHLFSRKEFGGECILPSIARNDPSFPKEAYWKGAVWPPRLITLVAKCAGTRSAVNPHATCDVAESGNGATGTFELPRQVPTLPAISTFSHSNAARFDDG